MFHINKYIESYTVLGYSINFRKKFNKFCELNNIEYFENKTNFTYVLINKEKFNKHIEDYIIDIHHKDAKTIIFEIQCRCHSPQRLYTYNGDPNTVLFDALISFKRLKIFDNLCILNKSFIDCLKPEVTKILFGKPISDDEKLLLMLNYPQLEAEDFL